MNWPNDYGVRSLQFSFAIRGLFGAPHAPDANDYEVEMVPFGRIPVSALSGSKGWQPRHPALLTQPLV